MPDPSIVATRHAITALLQPVVGLDPAHVTAYPPKPVNRPAVYVDSARSGDTATFCGPSIDLTVYAVGPGDTDTQRETLDGYVEAIVRAVGPSPRFAFVSFEPVAVEEAVPLPAYRITITAAL